MNKNVWLLFACQALMNAVMSGQTVMASLVGYKLSGTALNTLPMAIQMVAVMSASLVAGYAFPRIGRRGGFWLGCGIMMCGSLTFALGIYSGNFVGLLSGRDPCGARVRHFPAPALCGSRGGRSGGQGAGDLAGACGRGGGGDHRAGDGQADPRADPGSCLPGNVFVFADPANHHGDPAGLRAGSAGAEKTAAFRCRFESIFRRPDFVTAVVSSLVGYGTMNLVMASTPLQMMICGFGVAASADVIRAHSLAMFAPGFVTGRLIQWFGVHQIILLGGLLTLACVALNVYEPPLFVTFMCALMLLGVGWNFMFVGGTTMLTTAYAPEERVRVQATHDFIVFGSVAVTAVTSGAVQQTLGWDVLNLTVVPPVLIAFLVVGWHWMARARAAAVA